MSYSEMAFEALETNDATRIFRFVELLHSRYENADDDTRADISNARVIISEKSRELDDYNELYEMLAKRNLLVLP